MNTQGVVDEYTGSCGGIRRELWRNTQGIVEEYTGSCGGIHWELWRNTHVINDSCYHCAI